MTPLTKRSLRSPGAINPPTQPPNASSVLDRNSIGIFANENMLWNISAISPAESRPGRTIGSMRVYSRDELERLRAIKRLVDDAGINLAGVQRLLEIAEVVTRIRPLVTTSREESAREARRRLVQEVDELVRMLGLD